MERAASSGAGSFIGNAGGFVVLKTFSITDIGKRRKLNQDYVFVSDKPLGNLPNLFIVADGMGGHNAGDYASKCAVETWVLHWWRPPVYKADTCRLLM